MFMLVKVENNVKISGIKNTDSSLLKVILKWFLDFTTIITSIGQIFFVTTLFN